MLKDLLRMMSFFFLFICKRMRRNFAFCKQQLYIYILRNKVSTGYDDNAIFRNIQHTCFLFFFWCVVCCSFDESSPTMLGFRTVAAFEFKCDKYISSKCWIQFVKSIKVWNYSIDWKWVNWIHVIDEYFGQIKWMLPCLSELQIISIQLDRFDWFK